MTALNLNREWQLGSQLSDGQGGFGRVYAGQADDGSAVAIKLVPKEPGADRELLFDNPEATYIVPILDKGEWEDKFVIVMPMADESLGRRLSNTGGPLTLDDALLVLVDVAKALVEMQSISVVHRDLKPDNVLLLNGQWLLADFGIARYAEKSTSVNTRKHSMTFPYAAPEQWKLEQATSATDVYAFGVMAYEMLEGHCPFSGPDEHDFRNQHLDKTAPSLTNCPPTLAGLVQECMYKDPGARPVPSNIVARLENVGQATSPAAARLQAINRDVVEKRAVDQTQASAARSLQERRQRLYKDAVSSFTGITEALTQSIQEAAPSASIEKRPKATEVRLSHGMLGFDVMSQAPPESLAAFDYSAPFDVIAYSAIVVRKPKDRYDYEGRAHSLWFCDAHEEGVYRWYELAFMVQPMIPQRFTLDPFARSPTDSASAKCLTPVATARQVAWQPIPIDQGEERQFIERWISWFAAAADGTISHPRTMPEDSGGRFRLSRQRRR